LLNPGEVLVGHVREDRLEVFLMFFSELEGFDELFNGFESGKNGVVSIERVLPEEDFEGGLLFVLVLDKV
jgi:hypothetical protein